MKTSDRYIRELERRLEVMQLAVRQLKERGLVEKDYCLEKSKSFDKQLRLTLKQLEHEKKGIALWQD